MAEIRVQNLTKTFGDVRALDDVSFTFPNGQVTCLLGPSGCGKTTLMRIVAGLEQQTAETADLKDQIAQLRAALATAVEALNAARNRR